MRQAEGGRFILRHMKNSIGTSVILTVFGESHGPAVGVVLDGLAPGVRVDDAFIASQLSRRRPAGQLDTARVENDNYQIISGVHNGYATGAPLTIVIPNENVRSSDYQEGVARPSHSDYVAEMKYHGFEDLRGGGHFSGRVTAGVVAAGAICLTALRSRGITVGTHILRCGDVNDRPFSLDPAAEISILEDKPFPVLDDVAEAMGAEILAAKADGDSVGGVVQCAVCGLPAGVGEPWFDSLEGMISRAVFAIGGIKGIEFGAGFGLSGMRGSSANDPFRIEGGRVVTSTNNSGGINGGISNGMPLVFNMAVRPTPSVFKSQKTVDFRRGEEVELNLKGRHDPAIVRRICIVVTSIVAAVLCDALALRFGTDYLMGEQ